MRAVRVTFLPVLLLVFWGGGANARQSDVSVYGSKREGQRADVFEARHGKLPNTTLVKVPRPGVWVNGQFHFRTDALMKDHAARVMKAADALAKDGKSGAFFKKILPEMGVDAELPGWIFMSAREGVPLARLKGKAAERGRAQLGRALTEAQRILGTKDLAEDHFVFDLESGEITGWLSPFHQPDGQDMPFDYVGKAGEGRNSDAYLIKNRVPGQSHLTVLKVARPYSSGRGTPINNEALRGDISDDVAWLARTLRHHYQVELGLPIIPETASPLPGVLLQERVTGVAYDDMRGSEKAEAGLRLHRRSQRIAVDMFPRTTFSDSKSDHHVLFDKETGKPNGWYDFLNDNHPWVRARP